MSATEPTATRVVLSYPGDLSRRALDRVTEDYYRTFLRRAHDEAREGDVWREFTDVGCCGSQLHVRFRVERVAGGPRVGPETAFEFVARDTEEMPDPWSVQNEIT
ncbi:MAG: hypothetical protein ABEJ70_07830 [Halobacteriaceae archaeon]